MSNSNVASKTDLVKLRSRKTSNGRASLYLDYVQYDERVRDTLGLFLLSGKSPEVKEKNQKTMAKAELLRLSTEATATRRTQARILRTRKKNKRERTKSALRLDREKTIVNMYKSGHSIDDIWKVSGYKSRTSVFRVLQRNGVEPNRTNRGLSPVETSDQE